MTSSGVERGQEGKGSPESSKIGEEREERELTRDEEEEEEEEETRRGRYHLGERDEQIPLRQQLEREREYNNEALEKENRELRNIAREKPARHDDHPHAKRKKKKKATNTQQYLHKEETGKENSDDAKEHSEQRCEGQRDHVRVRNRLNHDLKPRRRTGDHCHSIVNTFSHTRRNPRPARTTHNESTHTWRE
jgi:hypothetical protein